MTRTLRGLAAIALSVATGGLAAADVSLTCDPASLDSRSYGLTTRAQARNLLEPRHSWWDSFDLGKYEDDLADLNEVAARLAERAQQIDPRNRMAYGILARQYVVLGEPERAEEAWARALDGGGAVVWSATLYDVDARTYFFLAFGREALRVYRMDTLAGGPVRRGFYGIPQFPDASNDRFYEAAAGCIDPARKPEAVVPWSQVREIKAGNWVLWFKLIQPITVSSDRTGKRKELREIKVALHGRTGELEVYKPVGEDQLALRGRGPSAYQDLVRRTLVKFVDPEKRIALPPLKPGVGW
jgi:tetratricopeptide (TPR) repeat protein